MADRQRTSLLFSMDEPGVAQRRFTHSVGTR
jgi:hypothetical protein